MLSRLCLRYSPSIQTSSISSSGQPTLTSSSTTVKPIVCLCNGSRRKKASRDKSFSTISLSHWKNWSSSSAQLIFISRPIRTRRRSFRARSPILWEQAKQSSRRLIGTLKRCSLTNAALWCRSAIPRRWARKSSIYWTTRPSATPCASALICSDAR